MTLKAARTVRLLTVRALADRAGVAPSTIHLIETGKARPRFGNIEKISAALEVAPDQITEFAAVMLGTEPATTEQES